MPNHTLIHYRTSLLVLSLSASLLFSLSACSERNNPSTAAPAQTSGAAPATPALGIKPSALDASAADTPEVLQAHAQAVYGNLQVAREAALQQDKKGFIKALGDARAALEQLPDTPQALATVVENPQEWAIFPVQAVREDLDAAASAGDNDSPYWSGALEAVEAALATFHWYGQAPSANLLAAYKDVLNAYAVAAAPEFRPEQNQTVLDQLAKAVRHLQAVAGAGDLQAAAQGLLDKVTPESGALQQLAHDIQQHIQQQRQQAASAAAVPTP